jgi:hypothetical protein
VTNNYNTLSGSINITNTNLATVSGALVSLSGTVTTISNNVNTMSGQIAALQAATHAAVTLGTANGLSLSGQVLSLDLASSGSTGALSVTDWNTFNNKINLTSLSATGGIVYNSGNGLFSWNGTTDNVVEGITNLYYTSARFVADFTAQFQAAFDTAFGLKTTDQLAE